MLIVGIMVLTGGSVVYWGNGHYCLVPAGTMASRRRVLWPRAGGYYGLAPAGC